MIDNITIKSYLDRITNHITPEFLRNIYHAKIKGNNDYDFILYNPENTTSSFLKVVCPHINSAGKNVCFSITGSLRKWWYGDKSVKDFSKPDFEEAVNYLLDILDISQKGRKHFIIPRIEIGMNILVKVPCSEILNSIVGYKNNCYSRNSYKTGISYETKTYKKYIKLYDKVEEISKGFKNKRVKDIDESQFLNDTEGKNILRVEFTIGGGQAKVNKELKFDNLEECIFHFDNLYSYFWNQLQLIKYCNSDEISIDDVIFGSFKESLPRIAKIGLTKYFNVECVDRKLKQTNNQKMRTKIMDLYKIPIEKLCSYDIHAFMIDIRNQMLYSLHKSDCLFLVQKLSLILKRSVS